MKRSLDIFFSLILLLLLLPLISLICVIIKLTSKGPVLFMQKRIGKNKKEFLIMKFRTMFINTPKDMPTHLLENPEAFITPVGKFLRRTSLDELPQLINILIGDMSFIGPRPALYNQYDLIELRDKHGVNSILPGLSGWAQINGRDELDIPTKVELDAFYLRNMSLKLDIMILFKTFVNVIIRKDIVEGKQPVGNKMHSGL